MFQRTQHFPLGQRFQLYAPIYVPNPPPSLGYDKSGVSFWGGTQFTSNKPADLQVDSSTQDTSSGCLDGVSNSGSVYRLALRPRLLAVHVRVRGYDYLQGDRIHSSSGRPLLYQTATHHITQSTEKITIARPVAVSTFQFINVPDSSIRSLPASPCSETHHRASISSSIRITPKRPPQSSEDQRDTPCAPQPGDSTPGKLHS